MESIAPNAYEMPNFDDLTNLSAEKLHELETVLASILALPIACETYAQIIEGKPSRTPYSDDIKAHKSHLSETIIVSNNTKPSDWATEEYEKFRTTFMTTFPPKGLIIDLNLIQAYQNALPGSHDHLLHLLQIAAASVHTLAGMMYTSFHQDINIKPPKPPEGHRWQFRSTDHFYVDFYHTEYQRFEDFPFGLLNVVGYWAEAELFGGVVLFERVASGSEIINAFLHPQKADRAFQLSQKQLKCFADLGTAGDPFGLVRADTVPPFVKELNARSEPTFIMWGEAPLRIYKNEYDKPPVSIPLLASNCVIREGTEEGIKMEKTMKIMKENGWDKEARTYPVLFQDNPILRDWPSAGDGASSSKDDASSKDCSRSAEKNGP